MALKPIEDPCFAIRMYNFDKEAVFKGTAEEDETPVFFHFHPEKYVVNVAYLNRIAAAIKELIPGVDETKMQVLMMRSVFNEWRYGEIMMIKVYVRNEVIRSWYPSRIYSL